MYLSVCLQFDVPVFFLSLYFRVCLSLSLSVCPLCLSLSLNLSFSLPPPCLLPLTLSPPLPPSVLFEKLFLCSVEPDDEAKALEPTAIQLEDGSTAYLQPTSKAACELFDVHLCVIVHRMHFFLFFYFFSFFACLENHVSVYCSWLVQ